MVMMQMVILSNHLFQRQSSYSLKLIQAFPDLIQCCSIMDKKSALKLLYKHRNKYTIGVTHDSSITSRLKVGIFF